MAFDHVPHGDESGPVHNTWTMTSERPNHLKAWRNFRRLTQQQLADKIDPPTSKSVIAAIESGQNGLSDKWLRKLAPVLGTTAGRLLDYAPEDLDTAWVEVTEAVPKERREEAIQILKVLSGKT